MNQLRRRSSVYRRRHRIRRRAKVLFPHLQDCALGTPVVEATCTCGAFEQRIEYEQRALTAPLEGPLNTGVDVDVET